MLDCLKCLAQHLFVVHTVAMAIRYYQRVFSSGLQSWCYYSTLNSVNPAPLPNETTPSWTGSISDFQLVAAVDEPISSRTFNVEPVGDIDGNNRLFTLPTFVNSTEAVCLNGVRLKPGVGNDYVTVEHNGVGTGYNAVELAFAPNSGALLLVDYNPV